MSLLGRLRGRQHKMMQPPTSVANECRELVANILDTVGPNGPLARHGGVKQLRTLPVTLDADMDIRLDLVVARCGSPQSRIAVEQLLERRKMPELGK